MKMRITRLKLLILIVMSVVGLAAASEVLFSYYLFKQSLPFCTAGSFYGIALDCNQVLGSRYSQIFGVPLELFAVVYFIVNLVLVYLVAFGSEGVFRRALSTLFAWRFVGLMIVPYLVFIELFILRAICVYCTIMHVAIIADFLVITYLLFLGRHTLWGEEEELEPTEVIQTEK